MVYRCDANVLPEQMQTFAKAVEAQTVPVYTSVTVESVKERLARDVVAGAALIVVVDGDVPGDVPGEDPGDEATTVVGAAEIDGAVDVGSIVADGTALGSAERLEVKEAAEPADRELELAGTDGAAELLPSHNAPVNCRKNAMSIPFWPVWHLCV